MKPARLPPLDADCMLEEDAPEVLDAYARGLLRHLRSIKTSRPKGRKRGYTQPEAAAAKGYTLAMVRAATAWLEQRYVETSLATPKELDDLHRELGRAKPNPRLRTPRIPRANRNAYWAAIRFEAEQARDPEQTQPSSVSAYAVAQAVSHLFEGRSGLNREEEVRRTVADWRKLHHYRNNVALFRRDKGV